MKFKRKQKQTILLLVFTFSFIFLLNTTSAGCEGNYQEITECSVVNCNVNDYINVDGSCKSGSGSPSFCNTVTDNSDPFEPTHSCQNTYTSQSADPTSQNTCPEGYELSQTTPTSCSTLNAQSESSCLYGCTWTAATTYSCEATSTGIKITASTGSSSTFSDSCINREALTYTCASSSSQYPTSNTASCTATQVCGDFSCVNAQTTYDCDEISTGVKITASTGLQSSSSTFSDSCINREALTYTCASSSSQYPTSNTVSCSSSQICGETSCITPVITYECTTTSIGATITTTTGINNNYHTDYNYCEDDMEYTYSCTQSNQETIKDSGVQCPVNQECGASYYCVDKQKTYTCVDTDDSSTDTSVKGRVIVTPSYGTETIKTDTCLSNGNVREYYCASGTSESISSESISCLNGYKCSVGKCVEDVVVIVEEESVTTTECIPGNPVVINMYLEGDIDKSTPYPNSCSSDSKSLTIFSCYDNALKTTQTDCEYGCSNKKCNDAPTPTGTVCSNIVGGIRQTTSYTSGGDRFVEQNNFCSNDGITLTTYSCNTEPETTTCSGGCENAKCQDSTSYWANSKTKTSLTSTGAVTENSDQEIKLIIKNVGSKDSADFEIFEKETNTLIDTVSATKEDNTLVASYVFTSSVLDKVKSENNEFTFYFTSNAVVTNNPEINLLIQREELVCPTEGSEDYDNKRCDDNENGLLCPLDCFIVGDGVCNEKLDEDILSSFHDCGANVNSKLAWANPSDLTYEITEAVALETSYLHEESFMMVAQDENEEGDLDFELTVVKGLKEFSLGNFAGSRESDTVYFEWTPTYKEIESSKEVPSQTDFKFFFKVNGVRSNVLKISLSESKLPSCFDKEKNGNEENVDCGGSCDLSCEEASFCQEYKIISCSAYTSSGESYCNENPCKLYGDSDSTCYWDENKCEKKTVGDAGTCYYKEEVEEEDTCEDGYLLYNYDSTFEWNEGVTDEVRESSIEDENCIPISEPVSCSLPGESLESKERGAFGIISEDENTLVDKLKIAFLAILAMLIIYFTIKISKSNKKDSPQKRIKDNFLKSEKERKKPKEKKIKGEVRIKTKKEREIEKLMEDFEMDI